jgi:hypothetical protein
MDVLEGFEKQVWRAPPAAFEELEDAPRIVDLVAVGPPVPDTFVRGPEREFEPFEFDRIAILRIVPILIHSGCRLASEAAARKDDF